MKGTVTTDGILDEDVWTEDGFLFVGSENVLNCYIRFAYDDDHLFVSIDSNRPGMLKFPEKKFVRIYLDMDNGKKSTVGEGVYRLDISSAGVTVLKADSSGNWSEVGNL